VTRAARADRDVFAAVTADPLHNFVMGIIEMSDGGIDLSLFKF
jgi:hypothetical protein